KEDISKFVHSKNWEINSDYHFGGYAKINNELIAFINAFKSDFNIPLDPIYTGKMMFGITDLINKNYFPDGARILAIHTGGLQGIMGMNQRLKRLNKPQINV
ncbi:MAG: 1-aminocyclopropane-1-carboxylate deaminase/D-cysteine desulfhydrase, partial [Bacteroidota bacterium]